MHKVDLEKELGQLYRPNAKEVVAVAFIDARTTRRGKHHEIYLSDIRRADPAKWKTIIRQPLVGGSATEIGSS
jgi:hypothetical protein